MGFSDSITGRVGFNTFTYKYNGNSGTTNYDFKLQLQTVSALADWYPFSGGFRTSAGLLYNNNKLTLKALPNVTAYTVGGTTYPTGISSVEATIAFNKIAPYLGIGWGNPVAKDKGWGMVSDFGVMFQGSPKTNLVVTCTTCPTANEIAAENAKLQSDLSSFKFWPVVSVGVSYQW
ncbi:MAG: hypothetical protein A3J49_08590 [Gallionellales bacterium RIFCSPHIGHO2_02_FULL_57_16]|nr:MAG: hypothetical protein A3J49_08590 [Gallionellales bacterium RIFCSPHIGHO2_02_FULL_57_16]